MYIYRIFCRIIYLFVFLFVSCSEVLINDFEVSGVSYDMEKIVVNFTSNIEGEKVKDSFSLVEGGKVSTGIFSVNGSSLIFYPVCGIQNNYDYELTISTQAEDINGKSLKEKFSYKFTTKKNKGKLEVISINPSNETILENEIEEIEIKFSKPVIKKSFHSVFFIEPPVENAILFNEDLTQVKVRLLEPISKGIQYNIKITADLEDIYKNHMAKDFISKFQYGMDTVPPAFEISFIDENGMEKELQEMPLENHFVPNEGSIKLRFNEKISMDYLGSYIEMYPSSIKYSYETDKKNGNFVDIKFSGKFKDTCILKIKKGIEDIFGNEIESDKKFQLCFDCEKFRPVKFYKAYIQVDDKENYRELSTETQYTHINLDPVYFANDRAPKETSMFLLFNVSEKSEGLDFFSAVDALSFNTTNSCCRIIIRKAEIFPVSRLLYLLKEKEPIEGKLCSIKFTLNISNTNREGLIEMNIFDSVRDSLGNKIDGSYCLAFNK